MAALNLAAIKIQKNFKGYTIRKHKKELRKFLEQRAKVKSFVSEKAYSSVQKLRSKFIATKPRSPYKNEDEAFQNFCASKIAASFKMSLTRRLFKFHRFSMYHIASLQIQHCWKAHIIKHPKKSKEDVAAHKIQMYFYYYIKITVKKGLEILCKYKNF